MSCASAVFDIDVSISDSTIVSAHRDGSIRFWSIRDHSMQREMKKLHDDSVTSAKYLRDSNQVITMSRDYSIKIIDTRMFEVVRTIESDNFTNSADTNHLGVSPTGRFAAVGSKNGSLIIVDIYSGEVEEVFEKEHTTSIVSCDWAKRGGGKVATIDNIGNLFLWE